MKKTILLTIMIIGNISAFCFSQEIITLDDYISMIEKNNSDVKAAELSIDAMGNKIVEADTVYQPFLSGNLSYTDDKGGLGFGSTLPVKEMKAVALNLGAVKKWGTGSTLTLGYTNSVSSFDLFSPTTIFDVEKMNFSGYEIKPSLILEQSLLRDYKSRYTKSGIKKAKASTKAAQYMQMFRKQQILLQARLAYWTLSFSRDVIAFRKVSLERAEKILNWTKKRVDLDLADKGDLLQAEASYKLRQLNLELALQDEIKYCRDFNDLLGLSSEMVDENLIKLSDIESFLFYNRYYYSFRLACRRICCKVKL